MVRPKFSISEDENLALEVQKYPCLYDRSLKEYKEVDRKKNAWTAIDVSLGMEEGLFWYLTSKYAVKCIVPFCSTSEFLANHDVL